MPAINKIERYGVAPRVLALSGEGKTTHEISQILNEEAAGEYTISQPTVSRWLKDVRQDRSNQTRQIVHDYLKATVPTDLESINQVQAWLMDQFRSLDIISPETVSEALGKTIDEETFKTLVSIFPAEPLDLRTKAEIGMKIVRVVDTKLRYAGVLEDPDSAGAGSADPVDLDDFRMDAKPDQVKEAANG